MSSTAQIREHLSRIEGINITHHPVNGSNDGYSAYQQPSSHTLDHGAYPQQGFGGNSMNQTPLRAEAEGIHNYTYQPPQQIAEHMPRQHRSQSQGGIGSGGFYLGGGNRSRPISPVRGSSVHYADYDGGSRGGGGDAQLRMMGMAPPPQAISDVYQYGGSRGLSPTRREASNNVVPNSSSYYNSAPNNNNMNPNNTSSLGSFVNQYPIGMNNVSDAFHNHRSFGGPSYVNDPLSTPQQFPLPSSNNGNGMQQQHQRMIPFTTTETRLSNIAHDVGATAAFHNAMAEMERVKNAEIRALEEENAHLREQLDRETEAREVAVKALCAEAATASYLAHAGRKRDLQAALWHWQRRLYKRQCERMSDTIIQTYDAVSSTIAKSSVVVDNRQKNVSKAIRELAAAEQQLVMRRIAFYANVESALPEGSYLDDDDDETQGPTDGREKGVVDEDGVSSIDADDDINTVNTSTIPMSPIPPTTKSTLPLPHSRRASNTTAATGLLAEEEDDVLGALMTSPVKGGRGGAANRTNPNTMRTANGNTNSAAHPAVKRLYTVTQQYKALTEAYAADVDIVAQRRMGVVAAYLESIADQLNLASTLRNHLRPFDIVAKKVLGLRSQLQQQAAKARAEAELKKMMANGGGGAGGRGDAAPSTNGTLPIPPPANPLDYTPSLVAFGAALDVYKDCYHSTIAVTALPPLLNLLRAGLDRMAGAAMAKQDSGGAMGGKGQQVPFGAMYEGATRSSAAAAAAPPPQYDAIAGQYALPYADALRSSGGATSLDDASLYRFPTAVKAIANYFYDGLEQVMLQNPMTCTANIVLQRYLDAHVRLPTAKDASSSPFAADEDGGTDNRHEILTSGRHSGPIDLARCKLYINPLVKSGKTFAEEMAFMRREGIAAAKEAKQQQAALQQQSLEGDIGGATSRRDSLVGVSNTSFGGVAGGGGGSFSSTSRVGRALDGGAPAASGADMPFKPPANIVVVNSPTGRSSSVSSLQLQQQQRGGAGGGGQSYDHDEVAARLADSLIMRDSRRPLNSKWDGVGGFTNDPLAHIAHIVGRRSPVRAQSTGVGGVGRSFSMPRASSSSAAAVNAFGAGPSLYSQQQPQSRAGSAQRASSADGPHHHEHQHQQHHQQQMAYQQQQQPHPLRQQQRAGHAVDETPLTRMFNRNANTTTPSHQQQPQPQPLQFDTPAQYQPANQSRPAYNPVSGIGLPPTAPPSVNTSAVNNTSNASGMRRPSPSRGQQYHQQQLLLSPSESTSSLPIGSNAPTAAAASALDAEKVSAGGSDKKSTDAKAPSPPHNASAPAELTGTAGDPPLNTNAPLNTTAAAAGKGGGGNPFRERSADLDSEVSSVSGSNTREPTPQRSEAGGGGV